MTMPIFVACRSLGRFLPIIVSKEEDFEEFKDDLQLMFGFKECRLSVHGFDLTMWSQQN